VVCRDAYQEREVRDVLQTSNRKSNKYIIGGYR